MNSSKKPRSHEENLYQADCTACFDKFNILKLTSGFNGKTVLNIVKCIYYPRDFKANLCNHF